MIPFLPLTYKEGPKRLFFINSPKPILHLTRQSRPFQVALLYIYTVLHVPDVQYRYMYVCFANTQSGPLLSIFDIATLFPDIRLNRD